MIIGLGGFVGAVARYGLSGLVAKHSRSAFPFGTLAVNVAGCLLIGAAIYLSEDRAVISRNWHFFITIGLLGAFTTFSTFGYETLELLKDRQYPIAAINTAANVILGLGAVWLGRVILKAIKF